MNSVIEIQANYLAQQWYNLAVGERPEVQYLLPQYLHLFPQKEEQELFLKEALRIARELIASPRNQANKSESFVFLKRLYGSTLINRKIYLFRVLLSPLLFYFYITLKDKGNGAYNSRGKD